MTVRSTPYTEKACSGLPSPANCAGITPRESHESCVHSTVLAAAVVVRSLATVKNTPTTAFPHVRRPTLRPPLPITSQVRTALSLLIAHAVQLSGEFGSLPHPPSTAGTDFCRTWTNSCTSTFRPSVHFPTSEGQLLRSAMSSELLRGVACLRMAQLNTYCVLTMI
jgi:hypothetical protein